MNGITILIWITIALIGIIAIIGVKLHYKGAELEKDEESILPSGESINEMISIGKNKLSSGTKSLKSNGQSQNSTRYQNYPKSLEVQNTSKSNAGGYITPQDNENLNKYEYESQNQVLINYDNTFEKFQEPIKQNQMDIMTQNNKDKTELKDLFTIDELIKESKRKDSEREKESQKIQKDDEDLTEIKESIRKKQEEKTEEPLIEEIIKEDEKEEIISDAVKETVESPLIDPKSAATQKDIDEAINTASKEDDKEIESISESNNITDVLLNSQEKEEPKEEIKQATLKTPSKVGENKDYQFGASIDEANLFEDDDNDDEGMDLDYRKDLDKFTNKIKGSKIFQDVREKFVQEREEPEEDSETYIRNVNEYDEFEPIINETHVDIEADYDALHNLSYDERLRQENTRRVFNMAKNSPEPELASPKIGTIKDKPARDNIKITINNNEVVLKKGDEIIFNHLGETYSSQVYAIHGDDISVRYRRKDITIKPEDVKKVY